MNAAAFSKAIGHRLNALITINARKLQRQGAPGLMCNRYLHEARADLLERMRKWMKGRGLPFVAIWAREYSKDVYEHWHIALHLPRRHRADLAAQMADWTGAQIDPDALMKDGDIAVSEGKLWHMSSERQDGPKGGPEGMAGYFGKAEPARVQLYGKTRANPDKVRRDLNGGQGPIAGRRYGVSRTLNSKAQAAHGFVPPYQRQRPQRPAQRV